MSQELVIGLGYKAGSGKSTVARHLNKHHGFEEYALADALKDTVSVLFGWHRGNLDNQEFKKRIDEDWGITPRQALQRLGTDCVRKTFGDDFWVKRLHMTMLDRDCKLKVISDVRMLNEAEAIKKQGGLLWQIRRPLIDDAAGSHISETEMDGYEGWDDIIDNDGTVELLKARVDVALAKAVVRKLETKK